MNWLQKYSQNPAAEQLIIDVALNRVNVYVAGDQLLQMGNPGVCDQIRGFAQNEGGQRRRALESLMEYMSCNDQQNQQQPNLIDEFNNNNELGDDYGSEEASGDGEYTL